MEMTRFYSAKPVPGLLIVVHVVMVFAIDPNVLRAMTTGRYGEERWPPEPEMR